MRRSLITGLVLLAALPSLASAQELLNPQNPYSVVKKTRVGGAGGWDYIYADSDGRKLYIPRTGTGAEARIQVFNLDTLAPAGTIPNVNAHAVVVDSKSGHGFTASKPVVMFDSGTLKPIKNIDVQGMPENVAFDPYKQRVYVISDTVPNATVIDANDGSVLASIDLGGKAESAVSDGQGRVFVTIEDTDEVVVVDADKMTVSARWDLDGVGAGPRGIAYDDANKVLFVSCANTTMVYMSAKDGKFLYGLPIGVGADVVAFNPATKEIFSAQDQGTVTISKVASATNWTMSGDIETLQGAKNIALDTKTGKLFLASAVYAARPEGPATPKDLLTKGRMTPNSFTILTMAMDPTKKASAAPAE